MPISKAFASILSLLQRSPIRSLIFASLLGLFLLCLHHVLEGPKPLETKWLPYPETPEARGFIDHFKAWNEGFGTRENGKLPGFNDYFETGMWFGALINSFLLGALLLTCRWWLKPIRLSPTPHALPSLTKPIGIILGLILIFAVALRLPLMNHSLWGDEEWALRKNVHGLFVPSDYNPKAKLPTLIADKAPLEFQPVPWERTFFYDKDTNNHYLFSIFQRSGHELWKKFTGAPEHAFSEPIFRLVPLLFCVLLFIILPLLIYPRFGAPAAILCTLLLCISPWHMRYSVEARAYGMLMTLIVVHLFCLLRALDHGTWLRWGLSACTAFLTMYTWKAALFPLLAMHAVIAFALWQRQTRFTTQTQKPTLSPFVPWLVTHAIAGAAFIQLFAPCHPQINQALRTTVGATGGPMDMSWLQNQLSHLLYGLFANPSNPDENQLEISLSHLWQNHPILTALTTTAIILLTVIGIYTSWKKYRTFTLLALAPFAGAFLQFSYFKWGVGHSLLPWYIIYLLPFLIVFQALGLTSCMQRIAGHARQPLRAKFSWTPTIAYLVLLLTLTGPWINSIRTHPRENLRAAAAIARPDYQPQHSAPTSTSNLETIYLWRGSHLYDPYAYTQIRDLGSLHHFLTQAKALNKKVHFTLGHRRFVYSQNPALHAILHDPQYFTVLDTHLSNRDILTLQILQWTGKIPPHPKT